MTRELERRCYAKINWTLHVLERRADGFHELETLFQSISLSDRLIFAESDADRFYCSAPEVPADSSNLVVRAVERLRRLRDFPPVNITLEKSVPTGGGLGGGSCNAAMTLLGINELFELRIAIEGLAEQALALGSDVPFFLHGGLCYATGRGERLVDLDDCPPESMLLVLPEEKVMTSRAFTDIAALRAEGAAVPNTKGEAWARDAIATRSFDLFRNDLEMPVFAQLPQLTDYKQQLLRAGAVSALMSGSGSTIFAVFENAEARDRAAVEMGKSVEVLSVEPVPRRVALGKADEV